MALWKICGRAGSGKTTWLCRRIGQAMQQGQPSYLIVPDQYTLQGERELMRHLHAEGLWHAEVLSISRLCERVLAQKPSLLKPMDRRGEAMAVSRMLLTLQDELTVYGRYAHSPQFAATLALRQRLLWRLGRPARIYRKSPRFMPLTRDIWPENIRIPKIKPTFASI